MKNAVKPIAQKVLIPLGLTAISSALDIEIHKKVFGSGTTTLVISNVEIEDIMKIVKSNEN